MGDHMIVVTGGPGSGIDKDINHTNRMILDDPILHPIRNQSDLIPIRVLDIPRHHHLHVLKASTPISTLPRSGASSWSVEVHIRSAAASHDRFKPKLPHPEGASAAGAFGLS